MKLYFVNRNPQSNGAHEVHTQECTEMPKLIERKYLGDFESCHDAMARARYFFPRVNGCKTCSELCHESADHDACL